MVQGGRTDFAVLRTRLATAWKEQSGIPRSMSNRFSLNTLPQPKAQFAGTSNLGVCCSGVAFALLSRLALKEHAGRRKLRTLASQKNYSGVVEANTDDTVTMPETNCILVNSGSLHSMQRTWSWKSSVGDPDNDGYTGETRRVPCTGLDAVPKWFQGNGPCELVYAAKEGIGTPLGEALRKDHPGSVESNFAVLSVFDVGGVLTEDQRQEVQATCQGEVDGMWHISLKVFGHTYDNVRMVDGLLPKQLAPDLRYQYRLRTERTPAEWDEFWADFKQQPRWNLDSFNVRDNNCNHFQAETVGFLVPGEQVDLVTAEQVLSPLDFGLKEPPKKLHRYANVAIMRGLLRRRVENDYAAEQKRTQSTTVAPDTALPF